MLSFLSTHRRQQTVSCLLDDSEAEKRELAPEPLRFEQGYREEITQILDHLFKKFQAFKRIEELVKSKLETF